MKTNVEPKKFYLLQNGMISYCSRTDEDIEYTSTDAFIEKAVDWLSNHVNDYIINDKYTLPNGKMNRDWFKVKSDMFEDFKKYMKCCDYGTL